jgi:hypothetical protein
VRDWLAKQEQPPRKGPANVRVHHSTRRLRRG